MKPLLVLLAGPNGAGKSTFYEVYLKDLGLPFLNADVLAASTGLGAYEAAGQIAAMREMLVSRREGFVTETVLSDPVGEKVAFLADAERRGGFDVVLIYIGVATPELSVERVASRARAGGHDVPVPKIRARYERSLANLERAIGQLGCAKFYDNSSYTNPHRFIAEFRSGKLHARGGGRVPGWARKFLPGNR